MSAAFAPSPITAEHIRRAREVTGNDDALVEVTSIPLIGSGAAGCGRWFQVTLPSRFAGSPRYAVGQGDTPESALANVTAQVLHV